MVSGYGVEHVENAHGGDDGWAVISDGEWVSIHSEEAEAFSAVHRLARQKHPDAFQEQSKGGAEGMLELVFNREGEPICGWECPECHAVVAAIYGEGYPERYECPSCDWWAAVSNF